jgi:CheY-like chemotaxis protein
VEPGRYSVLEVSDTGCGMSADIRARIFEPFFTTKEAGRGTGLGLSTVYGIVQQSGGAIDAQSEPGRGSTFRIFLPVVDATPTMSGISAAAEPLAGSETILFAEDDDSVRSLACRVLRKHGYTVLAASGGGEALLLCERHAGRIDLLLTDVVMPQMSGRELAERLASLRPDMRVLYTSGYTDDAILRYGMLDNTNALLEKPYSPETLLRRVRAVLASPILARAG